LGSKGKTRGTVLLARAEERKFFDAMEWRVQLRLLLSASALFTAVYWRGWAFDRGVSKLR
jgi:hypothetical protein